MTIFTSKIKANVKWKRIQIQIEQRGGAAHSEEVAPLDVVELGRVCLRTNGKGFKFMEKDANLWKRIQIYGFFPQIHGKGSNVSERTQI